MPKPGSDAWARQIDRAVDRAAERILKALNTMLRELPENAAPSMATELLNRKLAELDPLMMDWIMNEGEVREQPRYSGHAEGPPRIVLRKEVPRL